MQDVDLSGQDASKEDVQEARAIVRKYVVMGLLKLPPELAVQLPNIDRCLALAERVAASKK